MQAKASRVVVRGDLMRVSVHHLQNDGECVVGRRVTRLYKRSGWRPCEAARSEREAPSPLRMLLDELHVEPNQVCQQQHRQ